MTRPPHGTKNGTLHILGARNDLSMVWEWTGHSWSEPATNQAYSSSPEAMYALGWRYIRGAAEAKDHLTDGGKMVVTP